MNIYKATTFLFCLTVAYLGQEITLANDNKEDKNKLPEGPKDSRWLRLQQEEYQILPHQDTWPELVIHIMT